MRTRRARAGPELRRRGSLAPTAQRLAAAACALHAPVALCFLTSYCMVCSSIADVGVWCGADVAFSLAVWGGVMAVDSPDSFGTTDFCGPDFGPKHWLLVKEGIHIILDRILLKDNTHLTSKCPLYGRLSRVEKRAAVVRYASALVLRMPLNRNVIVDTISMCVYEACEQEALLEAPSAEPRRTKPRVPFMQKGAAGGRLWPWRDCRACFGVGCGRLSLPPCSCGHLVVVVRSTVAECYTCRVGQRG